MSVALPVSENGVVASSPAGGPRMLLSQTLVLFQRLVLYQLSICAVCGYRCWVLSAGFAAFSDIVVAGPMSLSSWGLSTIPCPPQRSVCINVWLSGGRTSKGRELYSWPRANWRVKHLGEWCTNRVNAGSSTSLLPWALKCCVCLRLHSIPGESST